MSSERNNTEKQIAEQGLTLSDDGKRRVAVTLLKAVRKWPSPHEPEFLEHIEDAPAEEKQAALEAAIDEGIAELDAGKGITGTPSELMSRIDKRLGMDRSNTA